MMEDSPYESFEPLDLPHVSIHGDEEPESSELDITRNFPQVPKVYLWEKAIPEQKQVLESNSDPGNEITVRSDPPLHTQPGETSMDLIDNLDLDLPIVVRKGTRECTNRPLYPLSHYVSLKYLSPAYKNFIADGSLERHKARLVVKGYTQTYGVDYQETFAPVAKMNTVRILLSLAAHYNWQLLQYDVKNAFLHGNKVCKLKKALYRLKQSPRAWFGRFAKVMKEFGYKQSQDDHTFFIKHSTSGGRLATEFEIKELGKLKYFLGIEVAYSTQGIFISQQKYVTDLLVEIGKIECKPVSTPMDPNHKLGEDKEELVVDKRMYQRLVGRLIYLAHTRLDIAYSGAALLKGNPGKGILFKKNQCFQNRTGDRTRKVTGSRFTGRTGGRTAIKPIILDDLRIKWDGPMKLYCDNKSTTNIAHNPIQYDKTKHIEIDRHFIKEKLEEGVVCMSYVASNHQLADILTKGLNSSMFHDLVFKLGMEDIYSSA
ncbi:Retrovirus-related Pol polyprotein from transposon RE1 [Vitis vinifera]|uniref:Retrovirus-related Pol polyprotein from transposon RE1 n=1 Tax=Vitis vinifera TaxID=29760 RepID=A0A438J7H5_VITVI|nr:Retrovirus-related Pol polyprotein from transposon RE1 [Vitis vinifera]